MDLPDTLFPMPTKFWTPDDSVGFDTNSLFPKSYNRSSGKLPYQNARFPDKTEPVAPIVLIFLVKFSNVSYRGSSVGRSNLSVKEKRSSKNEGSLFGYFRQKPFYRDIDARPPDEQIHPFFALSTESSTIFRADEGTNRPGTIPRQSMIILQNLTK